MDNNSYSERFRTIYIEKVGLLNKRKLTISLTCYESYISGNAFKVSGDSEFTHQTFCSKYSDIKKCEIEKYEGNNALKIEVLNNENCMVTYLFPFEPIYKINDVLTSLEEHIKTHNDKQEQIKLMQEEKEEQERIAALELKNFYDSTYDFHIKEDTPVYMFDKGDSSCFALYIGEEKSINFLYIDAASKSEIHSVIPYNEIHYYEKAGTVHYATTINADYTGGQTFGGSFTGGKISVGTSVLGGLLFGPMGMAIGAMASYKPAEYVPPTYVPSKLNINSDINKIDERSVILNYYSQQHKQYIDIELPQEIFNFLQTYLPDKKYAIVIEKEKQNAIGGDNKSLPMDSNDTIQRLQKLKQLYEMELISEQEYLEKKSAILSEI